MIGCWANIIGGCSSKISGEHIVSKSIFTDNMLHISGVSWLGEKKSLPKKTLEANILCTTHNNNLSELDTTAMELSSAIRDCYSAHSEVSILLNGWFFERWCLKVLCGLIASGWTEGGKSHPPKQIVEIAFGKNQFKDGAGLYILNEFSGQDFGTDIVQWNIVLDSETNSQICGILIILRGVVSLLTVLPGNPEPLIKAMGKTNVFDFTNIKLIYRPQKLSYLIHETKSKLGIKFSWK